MGDFVFYCSLCCNATFDSKKSLIDHLSQISLNLGCPICVKKFSSIEDLVEHLKDDDCDVKSVNLEINDHDETNGVSKEVQTDASSYSEPNTINDVDDDDKMYVEVLSKQMMKPCLQTQELKLVKEHGESRYVIVTDDDLSLNSGITIVTKQNKDGTISLTTQESLNVSSAETGIEIEETDEKNETVKNETESSQEERYSCNTCDMTFTSVLEHIQNYHNDQDVVVEEPLDENSQEINLEFDQTENEDVIEKQTSRRMITDTGDIIETPITEEIDTEMEEMKQANNRRYKKIDQFCNSIVKDIKNDDTKNGPYHKVVIKEVQTTAGNKVKVYNCMSCNVYVTTLSEFKQHPCKILKYPCSQCPVAYENSKSLCAHMKRNVSEITAAITKHECEVCNTIFPSSKSLKLHKRMHDPVKSRPLGPQESEDGTTDNVEKFLCNVCNKLIPENYRTIHQNSHKSSNKMNCDICNKKFLSKENLEMHMGVHNLDKITIGKQDKALPYECLYCNRKFGRPHEKVKHERIHTGEKPHSCDICGKSFRVSYCLTLHMRTHTGARPYACPHCNKRFKAHSVYNHHLLTHSDVRAYKCPYCPKAFKTSVQLAGHKNSHTKPFSCQQCNRPFASLYAVRVHMEIHSRQNSLKFSCTMCGASYARAFALKDHVRQAHKDVAPMVKDEEWMRTENSANVETDDIQLNKDFPQDINELGTYETELIIP
ncbi:zinc finger protein 221 [Danaus plexippus plexippus]|uniref:Zinc finger protein 221 n=1 Tax=Danaus plexippus plexippus TaxID=278856 RepID=A0A212EV17_DANPL|nr:zinc finger protein 221 [Danaus plexippus plexippus]